jgi:hypothetical protein
MRIGLGSIIARTKRIRLTSAVTVLSAADPVRADQPEFSRRLPATLGLPLDSSWFALSTVQTHRAAIRWHPAGS